MHAHAGRVEDGIRNRRGRRNEAWLSDALGTKRAIRTNGFDHMISISGRSPMLAIL